MGVRIVAVGRRAISRIDIGQQCEKMIRRFTQYAMPSIYIFISHARRRKIMVFVCPLYYLAGHYHQHAGDIAGQGSQIKSLHCPYSQPNIRCKLFFHGGSSPPFSRCRISTRKFDVFVTTKSHWSETRAKDLQHRQEWCRLSPMTYYATRATAIYEVHFKYCLQGRVRLRPITAGWT